MSAADTPPDALTDAEYLARAHAVLDAVEAQTDAWLDADVVDIDTHRTGGLLELTLPGGSKLILNTQPPLHELWLAARGGGFHFRLVAGQWVDTRDGVPLWQRLSEHASAQAGVRLAFAPAT